MHSLKFVRDTVWLWLALFICFSCLFGFNASASQRWAQLWQRMTALHSTRLAAITPARIFNVITVNTTADENGTNNAACSLREAITAANTNAAFGGCSAGAAGADVIEFNLGTGTPVITLSGGAPTITQAVTIDGATGGATRVLLDGVNNSGNGLDLQTGGCTIRSLVIKRFLFGIRIFNGSGGHTVQNCYIGTNENGDSIANAGNGATGIVIVNTPNNLIGGDTAGMGNVLGANGNFGIDLQGSSGNTVQGNRIGTDVNGTLDFGNTFGGINVSGATNNLIGGATPGARNIISGNGGNGVSLTNASNARVQGNYIGVNAGGTAALLNNQFGVSISGNSSGALIGGTASGEGNVISGNGNGAAGGDGIYIQSGSVTVQGNLIGLNATATAKIPNINDGIALSDATNTLIGGTTAGARNLIAGNNGSGVTIRSTGNGAGNNFVQGNLIGTNSVGASNLGNAGSGVFLSGLSSGTANSNTIGGTATDAGNVIAFNNGAGVGLGISANRNAISGNAIFSNGNRGIVLDFNNFPFNDPGDGDAGANNRQNFPVLTAVSSGGSNTTIQGTLNSTANKIFRLEFFSNAACDSSGHGEGQVYLGSTDVTTDSSSNAAFDVSLPVAVTVGQLVTATATLLDASNNPVETSEFSACRVVVAGCAPLTVAPATLSSGVTGGAYSQALTVSGGTAPYSFTLSGALPPGMGFSPSNTLPSTLSGTPTTTGVYNFTLNLTDQSGCTAQLSYALTVDSNIVNTTADEDGTNPAGCSLREAIIAANSNAPFGGCAAGTPGLDTIQFNLGTGTPSIVLTSALPEITEPISINGNTGGATRIELDGSSAGGLASGLRITAGNSTIRSLVINRFAASGISLTGNGGNLVENCYLGTNAAGTAALGNSTGVSVSAPNNTIGGTTAGASNVISGNTEGLALTGATATGNLVQGNFIGTNPAGTAAIANLDAGILIVTDAAGNTIGGTIAAARNVISGNGNNGVVLFPQFGTNAPNNTLIGNYIGTQANGTGALPNATHGILIDRVSGTTIGGTVAGAGNVIAFNGNAGVVLTSDPTTSNQRLLGNSIFSNGQLGIDLTIAGNSLGVTANDAGDSDTGANNLQNFPDLITVSSSGGATNIQGTLNSIADKTFRLEFFSNSACDSSGHGEGQVYLGSTDVTTDGSSNAAFNVSLPVAVTVGQLVTATATLLDVSNNPVETSEFSACRIVTAGCPTLTLAPATLPAGTAGADYLQTLSASGGSAPYTITVESGTLPDGLTLSSDGTLSGTPTTAGIFNNLVIKATDVNNCTAQRTYSMTIMCPAILVSPSALPALIQGQPFSETITATPAGTYTFTGSSLPAGLSLDSTTGVLNGTPTTAGTLSFTVSATGFGQCVGTRLYTLAVGQLNLAATGGEGYVDLNWTHSGFGALTGFKLYRALSINGMYTLVHTAAAGDSTYRDTGVTPNIPYFYKLTVLNNSGESNFSNPAAATPTDAAPPIIVHTAVASPQPAGVAIQVSATVTDNTGVQSVKLFFRTTGASNYSERAMVASGNNYAATILANEVMVPGVDYYLEARDSQSVTRSGQADNPYRITVVDRPFIDSLSPASGPPAGGTTVTISGRNFKANPVVRFDNAIATVTSASATQIVCTTPPHFPAVVDVRVVNSDGASDLRVGGFSYTAQATLSLPGNAAGPQGVRVQIPVNATGVQGLTAVDLSFAFNSAMLTAVSASLGTLTAGWSMQANLTTPGEVRLAMASQSGPVTGSGTLAVIEFDVPGVPGDSTPLTWTSATLNGGAVNATTSNGLFTVASVYTISGTVRHWLSNNGLGNVLLALTGDRSYTATSAANGAFNLSNVLGGNYTLTPSKVDQTSGISALDAALVLQHSAGLITLTGAALTAADVDRNGDTNSQDAFYILQQTVGLLGLPFPGAGATWLFTPATRSHNNLSTDQPNQDFTGLLLGDVNGSFTTGNAPSTLATLSLPEVSVPAGAEFSVLLNLGLTQGQVLGADVQLTYDPMVVTPLAVESGNLISDWLRAVNLSTPGVIRLALAGSRGVTASGDLLRLRWRATGAMGRTSPLTLTLGRLNEGAIGTTLTPGRVTIRSRPAPADFDLDGKTDLTVWRGTTGEWLVSRIGDSNSPPIAWGTSNDPYNDVVVPGDYDGDGQADAAIWRQLDGGWCIVSSLTGTVRQQIWGQRGDVPVPGDYDGDGKTDLAVWRPVDNNWYILKSSDGQYFVQAWGSPLAPYNDIAVPGDYDGDGKTDLAVFRRQTGIWYVRKSSDGQILARPWGTGTDIPTPSDYDGDGKVDFAVWRGNEGNWYVLQSSTGQFQITEWGSVTLDDVPVPGDYDGDGRADMAVFRRSNAFWYIKPTSTPNTPFVKQWGQGTDTPIPGYFSNRN
jgi:CSLREA domain-containing protein